MPLPNFRHLRENSRYLSYVENDIWLMDDHRWACLVWDEHRSGEKEVLIHADHHWDAVYDFHGDTNAEQKMLAVDSKGLRNLIQANKYIRFDSFIAPAVRRGLFDEVHFFCTENDGSDIGLDDEVLAISRVKQHIHNSIDSLSSIEIAKPLVFDLCLDLFADDAGCEPGNLWSDEKIQCFINKTSRLLKQAKLLTVSLSFGCSGTEDETRHLAEFVIPKLVAARNDA